MIFKLIKFIFKNAKNQSWNKLIILKKKIGMSIDESPYIYKYIIQSLPWYTMVITYYYIV